MRDFVFFQGHDILLAKMLNGAAIMDGALLLAAPNETCSQPQTAEHLTSVEMMHLKHIIILQKIDLINEKAAIEQHAAVQRYNDLIDSVSAFSRLHEISLVAEHKC